jgi:hypothetical protein
MSLSYSHDHVETDSPVGLVLASQQAKVIRVG